MSATSITYSGQITSIKFPEQERNLLKKRECRVLSSADQSIKLGTVGWLQVGKEPIEHILVRRGEKREFITMTEYRDTLVRCKGSSLPFSLHPLGIETPGKPSRKRPGFTRVGKSDGFWSTRLD